MSRLAATVFSAVLLLATARSGSGQQLEAAKPGHPDDLAVGPIPGSVDVRPGANLPSETKKVTLLFVTRSRIVYRDAGGRVVIHSDGRLLERAEGARPKDEWKWNAEKKQFEGPSIFPKPVAVTADRTDKAQLAGYLTIRAEFLHLELNNALGRLDGDRVKLLLRYANRVKEFAEGERLASAVVALFDLKTYADNQTAIQKESLEEFEKLRKLKIEEAKNLEAVRRAFQARSALGVLQVVAAGLTPASSDNEDTRTALALAGFGHLGQAVAQRDLDERMLKDANESYERPALAKMTELRASYREKQARLAGRQKAALESLGVKEDSLRQLDALADTLIRNRDLTAAIEVLEARLAYSIEKGVACPDLLALLNKLKAEDQMRAPKDAADRARRSDEVYALALKTIDAAKLVPNDPVFETDRVQVLTEGARLVHKAVVFALDPNQGVAWADAWDPRADHGLRVLNLALEKGTLADPDGAARATRALLMYHRGLYREAMEEGRKIEDLSARDPAALVNIARFYVRAGSRKEAVVSYEKALKAGFRGLRAAESDPDVRPIFGVASDLWKARDKPELECFLDPNPLSIGKSFPSYTLEIKNKTAFPLTNVKIKYVGTFRQGPKNVEAFSQELTIDYLGPAGAPTDTFFWPDAFKSPGTHSVSVLRITLDRKGPNGKPLHGAVPVKASDRSLYRTFWWYYRPYWWYL